MNLYLVQHGKAVDKTVDPERPLSPEGEADIDSVARFVEAVRANVPEVWHSGEARTHQTAERLARRVSARGKVLERQGLAPKDPVQPVLDELEGRHEDLMIVGHLPFISRLAGLLLVGDEKASPVAFEKGGVVCLGRAPDGTWDVRWMVTPKLLAESSDDGTA